MLFQHEPAASKPLIDCEISTPRPEHAVRREPSARLREAQPGDQLSLGKLRYGSRVGMQVDMVAVRGLGTDRARIVVEHRRKDAETFCREYELTISETCITKTLAIPLAKEVTANCKTGTFTDLNRARHRYAGNNLAEGGSPKYLIVDLTTGSAADGSEASGYLRRLELFKALCPQQAPGPE